VKGDRGVRERWGRKKSNRFVLKNGKNKMMGLEMYIIGGVSEERGVRWQRME
jgi:hypothetical protein